MNINQIIENFKNDSAFAEKYSALKNVDAILEQAKADGFDVTAEDIQSAIGQLGTQSGELSEADLAVVAGGDGKFTENRWDSVVCGQIEEVVKGRCCAPPPPNCDHFRREDISGTRMRYTCVMGRYDYIDGRNAR